MSAGLVLVVDDDPSVANALARLFRADGLEAETYPSAEGLLGRESRDLPSCLVLDIRMPGMGGLDVQDTLRRNRVEIPIVFITGHADVPTSVQALKAGAIDFIEKPFDDETILSAVRNGLSKDSERRLEQKHQAEIEARYLTLTPRERQVMNLVTGGLSNKQVAYDLGAAEKTIKIHRGRVMVKMQAGSLPELVRFADVVSPGP